MPMYLVTRSEANKTIANSCDAPLTAPLFCRDALATLGGNFVELDRGIERGQTLL